MKQDLLNISDDFVKIMKKTKGVIGAWDFGSVIHGLSDEFSDVDIVFLIDGNAFKEMENLLSVILSGMCDELVLCFREGFNSKAIISNSYLCKKSNCLHQFDVVLINEDYVNDYMCKIFYTDIVEDNIIFDTDGRVRNLCAQCPHGKMWKDKLDRIFTTYMLYFHMTAKYLNRQDYFKLNHAMRMLFDNHASLLLTGYDAISWGGAENKLGFIPENKQEHLKKYYCLADFELNRSNLLQSVKWFKQDMCDVLRLKGKEYDMKQMSVILEYWEK